MEDHNRHVHPQTWDRVSGEGQRQVLDSQPQWRGGGGCCGCTVLGLIFFPIF